MSLLVTRQRNLSLCIACRQSGLSTGDVISDAGLFSIIGSTPVRLSSVIKKCAQSVWRLLVKICPSLTGDSHDGNMTALAGELVAMDADVILGRGFVEHIFSEYKDNFLESFTAVESCDEFYDLPNPFSARYGASTTPRSHDVLF